MTRCMYKLAIVPATTLSGAIVAVLGQVSGSDKQMASIVDECCVGEYERIMGATATLMDQCGGRRSYHSNDTALACGHEQM